LVAGRRPAGPARPGPTGSWQPQASGGTPAASSDRALDDLVLQADSWASPGPLGPARPSRFRCGARWSPLGQPSGFGPLSRPSELGPWSRRVCLHDWYPVAGPPARPVPARPAHGSPRLPAAYRRQALTELMTIWSFRPTPGRIRAPWARPGPAGSSLAPRGAGPPKCRSRRAERGSVVGERWIRGIAASRSQAKSGPRCAGQPRPSPDPCPSLRP